MTSNWNDDLQLALTIADAADTVTMSRFLAADLAVETKADTSPVTEADKACEETIRSMLATQRPDDGLLGEEFGSADTDAQRRWIIDPIDGTKNYLRGVPVWCTLIALEDRGELVVGVASAPALGRRWWAARGQGAHTCDVDGSVRPLHVSSVNTLADASFSFSDEEYWDVRGATAGLRTLIEDTWRARAYGDFLSHVFVAEGAVDIAAEPALAPWDMAALVPIVEESGGTITAFDGSAALTGHCAVSTNGHLHEVALRVLRPTPASE